MTQSRRKKEIVDPYAKERALFHAKRTTENKGSEELTKILESHGFGKRPQATHDDVEKMKKDILSQIEVPEVDYDHLHSYIAKEIAYKVSKIPAPKEGKNGKNGIGIPGRDGKDGKDGKTPAINLDLIVNAVIEKLPKNKSFQLKDVQKYIDEAISKIPAHTQTVRIGGSVASIRALTDVNLDGLSMDAQGNYILASGGGGAVDSVNGAVGVVVLDADDIDDTSTTHKFATAGEKTKVGYLTVTQAVDLDALETKSNLITVTQAVDLDQMEIDIAALANGMVYKGNWDASAGTFPGAGVAQTGWFYTVSVAGTVNSVVFNIGDRLIAIVDNASATVYAANWTQLDATDAVTSVAGRTGNITLDAADIAETAGLKIMTDAERTKLSGIETSADVTDAGNVGSVNNAATGKTTPVDADTFPITDTEASNVIKKVTFTNFKAFLKTYIDAMTSTFTNKRITKRVGSTTSSATPTINTDNYDVYKLTAQTEAITSFTTNLTGTPTDGQTLVIQITGTAARAITWGASFEASTVALPTTTVTTAMLTVGFIWNAVTSKWRCVASA